MLRVDSIGTGPDLVMLHGWALNCGLFDGVLNDLAARFRVHCIDLPGHGHNATVELPSDINELAKLVLEAAPRKSHWLGWSLGGQTAMAAALLAPSRFERMVTVASTPRLIAGPDWSRAIPEQTLLDMANGLHGDFHMTVKHFLLLQVIGDSHAHTLLRELREKAYAHGEPDQTSLSNGLKILRVLDLRPQLSNLAIPLLAITGSRDRLAPPWSGDYLAENVQSGRSQTISGAAHAPFISHREEFLAAVFDHFSTE